MELNNNGTSINANEIKLRLQFCNSFQILNKKIKIAAMVILLVALTYLVSSDGLDDR